ncbi:hypothetical protein CAPTEDRAFT_195177 [Capitella teleta]|uniref:Uncharacterized protein n=1 Tax=Capitella teleta TaxID=283909 RepID=R7UD70_CAPTE|nr:hypothetical protein CAPTEDRAFT_195177 [Capitella teleta]|eukprot:ELU01748.1 hypothetical protein CAPTEDRAFT_195177 [Capitella teleta]
MTTAVDPGINDHMTKVQLRLLQQKLQESRNGSRLSSSSNNDNGMEQTVRLHQAMLRRQELMDKIKHEQALQEDPKRPRSYVTRRDRHSPPPSRRAGSLPPEFKHGN